MLRVFTSLTAGPIFRHAFAEMEKRSMDSKPNAIAAYANALAYGARLGSVGDDGESPGTPRSATHFPVVDADATWSRNPDIAVDIR